MNGAVNAWGIVRQKRIEMQKTSASFPIPDTLFEHVLYTQEVPYCIEYQRYDRDTVTRPHYAHTLEVIISFGVQGDYNIGGMSVPLEEDGILFIPPDVIHSGILRLPQPAHLINLKFDLEQLRPLIDIEHMYAQAGFSVRQLISCQANREETICAVDRLIHSDNDLFERSAALIRLFGIWARGISASKGIVPCTASPLDKLIQWTEQNYKNHITIDDAARVMHLSRSYFCSSFKRLTGMTYLNYLNRLRIEQAQLMLLSGKTASECCEECGFDDLSYFVQRFRKETGYTTRQFAERFSRSKETVEGNTEISEKI